MKIFAAFVKKNLKKNISKIKIAVKLETIFILQENIEVLHIPHAI